MKTFTTISAVLVMCFSLVLADEDGGNSTVNVHTPSALAQLQHTLELVPKEVANLTDSLPVVEEQERQRIIQRAQELTDQINSTVADLQQQADASGVNASSCFRMVPSRSQDLVQNFTVTGLRCVTDRIDDAGRIVLHVLNTFLKINETLVDAVHHWRSCMGTSNPGRAILCDGVEVSIVGFKAVQMLTSVVRDIERATVLIATVGLSVSECVVDTFTSIPARITRFLESVARCVQGLVEDDQ